MNSVKLGFLLGAFILGLSGCAAPLLIAMAPGAVAGGVGAANLIGGSQDKEVEVTVDPISASVKDSLMVAKSLAFVVSDRSEVIAADLFETRGGYKVKIDRQTAKLGELTNSERREALSAICKSSQVDVALLFRSTKLEGSGVFKGLVTGRVDVNMNWTADVLICKTSSYDSFGGLMHVNVGLYNNSRSKLDEAMGSEMGNKILIALGKLSLDTDGKITGVVADRTQAPNDIAPLTSAPIDQQANVSPQDTKVASVPLVSEQKSNILGCSRSVTNLEIQQRLLALGFNVGKPDGIVGKRTVDAIKKYQIENRIKETGVGDSETIASLFPQRNREC